MRSARLRLECWWSKAALDEIGRLGWPIMVPAGRGFGRKPTVHLATSMPLTVQKRHEP